MIVTNWVRKKKKREIVTNWVKVQSITCRFAYCTATAQTTQHLPRSALTSSPRILAIGKIRCGLSKPRWNSDGALSQWKSKTCFYLEILPPSIAFLLDQTFIFPWSREHWILPLLSHEWRAGTLKIRWRGSSQQASLLGSREKRDAPDWELKGLRTALRRAL